MSRRPPVPRRAVLAGAAVCLLGTAAWLAGVATARSGSTQVLRSLDSGLCPFPLHVTISRTVRSYSVGATRFERIGPTTVTLRNGRSGRSAVLDGSGTYTLDSADASIAFSGTQVWFFAAAPNVPYLITSGTGTLSSPYFTLRGSDLRSRVIDPCALVSASPAPTGLLTTPAPWPLPAYALSRMRQAHLIPILGELVRHDHVHLDVIVNGRKLTIPAGVGMAQPVDGGPCPPGSYANGDCASGNFYTARVANSPLHTHSTSGIIHIEADRPGTFTLGQFFAQWGVRFDARCLGGYCAGHGKQLRVYVNGTRITGDPQAVVLTNKQEIAVVYGGASSFGSVPSAYRGGWPGNGCGGPGETRCIP